MKHMSQVAHSRAVQGGNAIDQARRKQPVSGKQFCQKMMVDNRTDCSFSKKILFVATALCLVRQHAFAQAAVRNLEPVPGRAQGPVHGGGYLHLGQATLNAIVNDAGECLKEHSGAQDQQRAAAYCAIKAAMHHGSENLPDYKLLQYTATRAVGVRSPDVNAPPAATQDALPAIKNEIRSKFAASETFIMALERANTAFKQNAGMNLYDSNMPSTSKVVLRINLNERMLPHPYATEEALKAFGEAARVGIKIEVENMHGIDQRIDDEQARNIQRQLGRLFMTTRETNSLPRHRNTFAALLYEHLHPGHA